MKIVDKLKLQVNLNKEHIKPYFIYDGENYFVLLDAEHVIKLIKNAFGEMKQFVDVDGNIIDFNFLVKLNELQEKEGLHLGNKMRQTHIKFFKQKMRVKFATQK